MGFYATAADLATRIENFKRSFTCGLPQGGKADLAKFRRYYDQLPRLEREVFRMNHPLLYRYWVKAGTRPPKAYSQIEMFTEENPK